MLNYLALYKTSPDKLRHQSARHLLGAPLATTEGIAAGSPGDLLGAAEGQTSLCGSGRTEHRDGRSPVSNEYRGTAPCPLGDQQVLSFTYRPPVHEVYS